MPTWKINGDLLADLLIANGKLTYGNMLADTFTCTENVPWDSGVTFSGSTTRQVLTRDDVTVFVGISRESTFFTSSAGEGINYTLAGPWDWLERRSLLQDHAVVVDPDVSTVPTLLPQGLVILMQDDDGTSVNVEDALAVVINQAIANGVPILLGTITGFDYATGWDEISDLNCADAIIRLLSSAPDAVVWWDYTTTTTVDTETIHTPTIHIGRRANLEAITLAIAPAGTPAASIVGGTYACFTGHRLRPRGDLIVSGVHIIYRRLNTRGGTTYLQLETESAGPGAITADNALVRTVTLAGSSYVRTVLSLEVSVTALAPALTAAGTITSGTDFDDLAAFWKRKHSFLADAGVTITEFRGTGRAATDPLATLDDTLDQEIVGGGYAAWMSSVTVQDQTYTVEVAFTKTINGATVSDRQLLTAGVLASNASTRTYTHTESTSYTPPEPTPVGLAASLYAALSTVHYEGAFTLVEQDCALAIRPQHKLNFSGGRVGWASMNAVVQSVSADLDSGTTEVRMGLPSHLGPADLVEICRANRLKSEAERGMMRTTGLF